jgi:hypothetical protein
MKAATTTITTTARATSKRRVRRLYVTRYIKNIWDNESLETFARIVYAQVRVYLHKSIIIFS